MWDLVGLAALFIIIVVGGIVADRERNKRRHTEVVRDTVPKCCKIDGGPPCPECVSSARCGF